MAADVLASGFIAALGIEVLEQGPDRVTIGCAVTPALWQPHGIVHGGVYCSLVETAASVGAGLWLGDRGDVVGVANHTSFLRAVRTGRLRATATPTHRGRSLQLWQVSVVDEADRLVAQGEVRLMNLAAADRLAQASDPAQAGGGAAS